MRDPSSSPHQPGAKPPLFWRIRHSPAVSAAALLLFLVVSVLWLVAAGTAQVAAEIQPPCLRSSCPQSPADASFRGWLLFGIAGTVLTLASFALLARDAVRGRPGAGARQVRWAVVAGLAGVPAEMIVVLLVTHVAIVNAPLGFENSGEAGVAIGILAAAQPVLAGALALVWARIPRAGPAEPWPSSHRTHAWRAILGLGGMVLTCAALAAWSINDGNALLVHTRLIAGTALIRNSGAWWPGLFAAMAALTLIAAACAPGLTAAAAGQVPPAPSASDRTASAAGAP